MKKILSIVAVAGLFAVTGCTKCATCDCTVTSSNTYTDANGNSNTTTGTSQSSFTACDHDITYWEENPSMTNSDSNADGSSSASTTNYSCTCA